MPTRLAPDAPAPVPLGNAAAGLGALLSGLGLKDVETRASIEDTVLDELAARGLAADVTGVRFNVVTLYADPHNATLLSYDQEAVLAAVNARLDSPVDRIVVKTRRITGPGRRA